MATLPPLVFATRFHAGNVASAERILARLRDEVRATYDRAGADMALLHELRASMQARYYVELLRSRQRALPEWIVLHLRHYDAVQWTAGEMFPTALYLRLVDKLHLDGRVVEKADQRMLRAIRTANRERLATARAERAYGITHAPKGVRTLG